MSAQIAGRLHEQMHKLPGMPPHSDAARLNHSRATKNHGRHPAPAGHHPALRSPNPRHVRPPRVLVAWQEWIGGLFSSRGNQG